jgi:hypothetical protein
MCNGLKIANACFMDNIAKLIVHEFSVVGEGKYSVISEQVIGHKKRELVKQ